MGVFEKFAKVAKLDESQFEKIVTEVQAQVINDLDKYRQEQMRLIDIEIAEEKHNRLLEVRKLAIRCADEIGEHEHNYHHTMELRGIELAKLEARIDALKEMEGNDARCYKEIIKHKDNELEYLRKLIDKLVEN